MIKINDEYYINANANCYILQRLGIIQDKDSKKTFYGTFCYIIYLLSQIDIKIVNEGITQFNNLTSKYQINLELMGFPKSWQNLTLFK